MNDSTESRNVARKGPLKAIVLLAVIFGLGALAGAGATVWTLRAHLQDIARDPSKADGPAVKVIARVEEDLTSHLDLTPDERAGVQEELEFTRAVLRERRGELVEDLRQVALDTVERLEKRVPEEKRAALRERVGERLDPWGVEIE